MALTPYYTKTTVNNVNTYTWNTNLPTASEIRNRWCFGLPLSKEDGSTITDEDLTAFVMDAVATVERRIGVYLKPMAISCNPDERRLVKGTDYEVEEPAYDYDARSWMNYGFLQLRQRHVRKVEGFSLVLPNGMVIMDFMTRPQWLKVYKEAGQIQLVPYAGDPTIFALMGGSQSGYPFVTGTINSNLPQMIYVDYTAGYELWAIPEDIRNIVARIATCIALGIAGEALLAGVASLSTAIDGLSESFSTTASATNTTYGAHVYQYLKEINEFFDPKKGGARTSERGILLMGL